MNPFANISKSMVLQEARVFHVAPINPARCVPILTQVLYLLHQGEKMTQTEATDLFFAVTKLFQSDNATLRRMVYLVVKELSTLAADVIVITAAVMKDLNSKSAMYKANSVRVLCDVTDSSMLSQLERYIMQAILDKDCAVSSAALVSAMHLSERGNKEIVRRWGSQVQEALKNRVVMVQYHALGLMYKIKQTDRLAVRRLVESLVRTSGLRCPYAYCFLIRLVAQVIAEDPSGEIDRSLYEFLETCLRHHSEMVIYEAARSICNIRTITVRELTPAITVLQLLLSSQKSSHKFAAVRTLNVVAMSHPTAVTQCIVDLEALIKDTNRSIATLAITTLLKTGSEASVERLMKQMAEFMSEIPDEFKVVVIEAIRSLCLKYPAKYRMLMAFLATSLRDEGGYDYKRVIVETIMLLIDQIPDSRDSGLAHLCEFIEDCEFARLSVRVLFVLGEEGPRASNPSRFIRYIFNRVILEKANVRSAAISALAKFGFRCAALRSSVIVLLRRCLHDPDDEVRDRCAVSLTLLEAAEAAGADAPPSEDVAVLLDRTPLPLDNLEEALLAYQANPTKEPFDLASVKVEPAQLVRKPGSELAAAVAAAGGGAGVETSTAALPASASVHAELLAAVPELKRLGAPYTSSKPVALTEDQTEYQVSLVKHACHEALVLQFNVTNTIEDQQLRNVVPELTLVDGDPMVPALVVPAAEVRFSSPGTAWLAFRLSPDDLATAVFSATLKFRVVDCDRETGEAAAGDAGYEDEYGIKQVAVVLADYMQRSFVPNFAGVWDRFDAAHETIQVLGLAAFHTLPAAVAALGDTLGMQVCERTGEVPASASNHTLLLAGVFRGRVPLLCRIRLKIDQSQAVVIELTIRCAAEYVRELILAALS